MKFLSGKSFPSAVGIMMVIILTIMAAGCSKDNKMGILRGQWQLLSIEYPDGKISAPTEPRLYISFDQNILQLTSSDDLEGFNSRYIGRVTGEYPDLTFSFPAYTGQDKLDIISRWGIESDPVAVKVESDQRGRMILRVGNNILNLRKY